MTPTFVAGTVSVGGVRVMGGLESLLDGDCFPVVKKYQFQKTTPEFRDAERRLVVVHADGAGGGRAKGVRIKYVPGTGRTAGNSHSNAASHISKLPREEILKILIARKHS